MCPTFHPCPGPASHWKNITTCFYTSIWFKTPNVFSLRLKKDGRVRIKCILRAAKWSRQGGPRERGCCHGPRSISLQQIDKVLSFTSFYCFCCLPSLNFSSTILKRKRIFFSYTGATFFDCKNIWWPFDECLPQWINK